MFRRFFLLLVFWTAGTVAAVGVLAYRMARAAKESARTYHRQIVEYSNRTLDSFAKELNSEFAFVADIQLLDPGSAVVLKSLQAAAATHPDLVLLAVVDATGREVVRMADSRLFPGPTPRSPFDAMGNAVRDGGEAVLGPVSMFAGSPTLPIAYPLRQGRMLLAAVGLDGLFAGFREQRVGASGRIVLADKTGRVFLRPSEEIPQILSAPAAEAEGFLEAAGNGQRWIGAFHRSKPLSWIVATFQPEREAYLEADRFMRNALLLFLMLAAASGISAGWLSKQIVYPLADIVEAANRASQNIFNVPVRESGWPELRALGKRFNFMMQQLKSYQGFQIEKVLEEKSKVDALVQTIPDGILMADLGGKVLFTNPSMFQLLNQGKRPTIGPGAKVRDLVRDPNILELAEKLLRKESRWVFGDASAPGAGGVGTKFLKVVGTTVSVGDRAAAILLLLRDVSIEKQLDQMKEEFFHSVIHDLRNPLATIGTVLELSQASRTLTPREEQYHRIAQQAYTELNGLLEDVLDLSKLETGTYELMPEPTDISAIARRSVELNQLRSETKGLKLELALEGSFTPFPAEGRKLQRVITNFIGNAMKFTPKGGKITVCASQTQAQAQVAVQDTGPGIPADKLHVVFEKFKQLDLGKQERSGFGLGLTICKRFVEIHDGKIWAESPPGTGARFIFTVPVKRTGKKELPSPRSADKPAEKRSLASPQAPD